MNEVTIPLVDSTDELSGQVCVQQSGKHVRLRSFPHWMSPRPATSRSTCLTPPRSAMASVSARRICRDDRPDINEVSARESFFTLTENEAIVHAYIDIPFKGSGWIKKIVPAERAEAWAKELMGYEDAPGAPEAADARQGEPK